MDCTCADCGQSFEVTESDQDFLKRIDVPPPKRCPECRLMRRFNERNSRKLYYRKCDKTGKRIISTYHSDHKFPVYDVEEWWGDGWDPMQYGRDFDFDRPFFEQYQELENDVPHMARFVISGTLQNSDFTNCTGYIKNCYLIAECDYDEDCYFSNRIYHSKNMVDCSNCYKCELCYEAIDCSSCHRLKYSQDCENCHDSFFLKKCIGCYDCIGCINQRHKKYMIFNEQLTQEEYEKRKKEMKLENYSDRERIRKDATEFFKTQPHKYIEEEHNENCTGDHLYDSKNSSSCWDCKDLEDCKYCAKTAENVKTCMDYNSWGFGAELIYMTSSCGDNVYNLKFCTTCTTNNSDLEYCGHCTSCKHCFGCFGLKHKKYCIFNKQYSEEEYEDLKRRIINHMRSTDEYGEYFPKDICPYAYNETIAMEYFPLTKEGATKRGYKWHDEVDEMPEVEKVIDAVQLPDETSKIPDDVLNWALRCKETNRPFRITKQELEFYRDQKIPIPRFHPDERHTNRMKLRPPRKLFERNCDICNKDLKSTFSTERPEKILCDHCYREEVY